MPPQPCQGCPPLEVCRRNPTGPTDGPVETVRPDVFFATADRISATLTVIFAQADAVRECERCRRRFTEAFRIPELWWTPWCRRANSFFGADETSDAEGNFNGYNTWIRLIIKQTLRNPPPDKKDYFWFKFNIFTRWTPSKNETTVIVFDPKPQVKQALLSTLLVPDTASLHDPYWIYLPIVQEFVRLQDAAVWGIRELVRDLEKNREDSKAPNPDYGRVHDIARHAIHVSETTDLGIQTIEHILSQHDVFVNDHASDARTGLSRQIRRRLQFFEHMLQSLHGRSSSNKDRLLNEIQLAFHTVAQYDSRISVEIARSTQYDSFAMRMIAFLTLTFLPATFVSALFSMSFFSYDPSGGEWTVSDKFWIYWAVAAPVTAVTILLWLAWPKFFPPDLVGKVQLRPRGHEDIPRAETLKIMSPLRKRPERKVDLVNRVTV